MVVDATAPITINVLANPYAHIDAMRQLDPATSIWYNLFPEGQQGYCTVDQTCWINLRLHNIGTAAGQVYLKITRTDINYIIWNQTYNLERDAYVDIDQISFIMPLSNITLVFEIGHY